MNLNGDFKEFLKLFVAHRVKFLLVGAQALAVHGRPRFTGDLDVWIERSDDNAAKVVAALTAFGDPARAGTCSVFGASRVPRDGTSLLAPSKTPRSARF
ncbi:MAG: hypothetical protein R3A78_14340 [Polyangiales bacterium]|nr:hypothetical protein [Myxococcales bacterium]